jgi:hypothetical protein
MSEDNCSVRYRFRLFIVGIGIGSLRWARIRNSMLSISACVYCPGIIIMPTGDLRSEAFRAIFEDWGSVRVRAHCVRSPHYELFGHIRYTRIPDVQLQHSCWTMDNNTCSPFHTDIEHMRVVIFENSHVSLFLRSHPYLYNSDGLPPDRVYFSEYDFHLPSAYPKSSPK